MKICPRCQRTYADNSLNFCLEDGTLLNEVGETGDSLPETVMINQPIQTAPNQSFGNQTVGQLNNWAAQNPNTPPKRKSKSWIWVLGILGVLFLVCGGGVFGFFALIASFDQKNSENNSNNFLSNVAKSPAATDKDKTDVQTIDLSKWDDGSGQYGNTDFKDGEFIMSSKNKRFYFVLVGSPIYKSDSAVTKVTVRNVDEEETDLGFGLIVHSNPVPLTNDFAFLVDSENKRFRIVNHAAQKETEILKWTKSNAIKDGTEKNILEVRDQSDKMDFYINSQFVTSVDNKNKYKDGVPGIYVSDAIPIAFSNLEIRK